MRKYRTFGSQQATNLGVCCRLSLLALSANDDDGLSFIEPGHLWHTLLALDTWTYILIIAVLADCIVLRLERMPSPIDPSLLSISESANGAAPFSVCICPASPTGLPRICSRLNCFNYIFSSSSLTGFDQSAFVCAVSEEYNKNAICHDEPARHCYPAI